MKDRRLYYVLPLATAVGLLVATLMVYAGLLTSDWLTLLSCLPAVVVTIGVVTGMAAGVLLFGTEEAETQSERAHPDGTAVFDWLGGRLGRLVHGH